MKRKWLARFSLLLILSVVVFFVVSIVRFVNSMEEPAVPSRVSWSEEEGIAYSFDAGESIRVYPTLSQDGASIRHAVHVLYEGELLYCAQHDNALRYVSDKTERWISLEKDLKPNEKIRSLSVAPKGFFLNTILETDRSWSSYRVLQLVIENKGYRLTEVPDAVEAQANERNSGYAVINQSNLFQARQADGTILWSRALPSGVIWTYFPSEQMLVFAEDNLCTFQTKTHLSQRYLPYFHGAYKICAQPQIKQAWIVALAPVHINTAIVAYPLDGSPELRLLNGIYYLRSVRYIDPASERLLKSRSRPAKKL